MLAFLFYSIIIVFILFELLVYLFFFFFLLPLVSILAILFFPSSQVLLSPFFSLWYSMNALNPTQRSLHILCLVGLCRTGKSALGRTLSTALGLASMEYAGQQGPSPPSIPFVPRWLDKNELKSSYTSLLRRALREAASPASPASAITHLILDGHDIPKGDTELEAALQSVLSASTTSAVLDVKVWYILFLHPLGPAALYDLVCQRGFLLETNRSDGQTQPTSVLPSPCPSNAYHSAAGFIDSQGRLEALLRTRSRVISIDASRSTVDKCMAVIKALMGDGLSSDAASASMVLAQLNRAFQEVSSYSFIRSRIQRRQKPLLYAALTHLQFELGSLPPVPPHFFAGKVMKSIEELHITIAYLAGHPLYALRVTQIGKQLEENPIQRCRIWAATSDALAVSLILIPVDAAMRWGEGSLWTQCLHITLGLAPNVPPVHAHQLSRDACICMREMKSKGDHEEEAIAYCGSATEDTRWIEVFEFGGDESNQKKKLFRFNREKKNGDGENGTECSAGCAAVGHPLSTGYPDKLPLVSGRIRFFP